MNLVCIVCPRGCEMTIDQKDGEWKVTGNGCRRGIEYAVEEAENPKRTLTSSIPIENGDYEMTSVKTEHPIEKTKIQDALKAIGGMRLKAPVRSGDCLIENIAGTGVRLVATRTVQKISYSSNRE